MTTAQITVKVGSMGTTLTTVTLDEGSTVFEALQAASYNPSAVGKVTRRRVEVAKEAVVNDGDVLFIADKKVTGGIKAKAKRARAEDGLITVTTELQEYEATDDVGGEGDYEEGSTALEVALTLLEEAGIESDRFVKVTDENGNKVPSSSELEDGDKITIWYS